MASANATVAVKKAWLPGNPWLWLTVGMALCVWAWLWALVFGKNASDNRVIVLALGLLGAGAGVWLRFHDRQAVYVRTWSAPAAVLSRLGMALLFGLLALGVTGLFISTFYLNDFDFKPGATFLVWLSVAPLGLFAAKRCLQRTPEQSILDADEELGLALLVAAACALAGSMALDLGGALAEDWDSIRVALRVLTSVGAIAAALVLVSTRLRRLILSLLFVLHFAGIANACLMPPPSPPIVGQIWTRVFRPYLQFMYLNNAYHFYAPEPGPAGYLWFRVIYTTDDGKHDHGEWIKIPRLDDQGHIGHPVALEYQRFLALTESVGANDLPPAEMLPNPATKQWEPNPFYMNRLNLAPGAQVPLDVALAKQPRIPLHPALIPPIQQVKIPSDVSKKMLASLARHIAGEHPTTEVAGQRLSFKSVKIYRVTHRIPPVIWFRNKIPPTDPELYLAFYTGNYDKNGKLIDDGDAYLYWLVPTLRKDMNDPDSEILDFCRLHAGDTEWVRPRNEKTWVWKDPAKVFLPQ